MTAAVNQDFTTYAGDDVQPIFIVLDGNVPPGAVDISTATQITWFCQRNADSPILITKTKTAGDVTFVTTGVDGRFQVDITHADTATLDGWYVHGASLVDSFGNVTTVTVGRMHVGAKPQWTYDPGSVASTPLYQVRLLVGDTLQGEQQMMDGEINWFISQYSNVKLAAAAVARALAMKFARQVDLVQGQLKTNYSEKSKQYFALQRDLEMRGYAGGAILGYAGGISVSDVQRQDMNTDRIQPEFVIGISDNFLPVGPVGNEQPLGNATPNNDWMP